MVCAEKFGIARVLALGAEGQEEVLARPQSPGLEQREDDVARGAGIGGALQDDELARPEPRGDGLGRVDDVAQVGLARLGQGRGDADDDGVGLVEAFEPVGGLEAAGHLADDLGGDVADVALAAAEPFDLGGVDVEAEDGESAVDEGPGQRQPDVAEADDADRGRLVVDPGPERSEGVVHRKPDRHALVKERNLNDMIGQNGHDPRCPVHRKRVDHGRIAHDMGVARASYPSSGRPGRNLRRDRRRPRASRARIQGPGPNIGETRPRCPVTTRRRRPGCRPRGCRRRRPRGTPGGGRRARPAAP